MIDRKVVSELSGNLPVCERPYLEPARRIGISEKEFLDRARKLLQAGYIRKVGAVVSPRKAGFKANGMVVFRVPPKHINTIGKKLSSIPEVTHCYERHPGPDFPYNIYFMLHGRSKKDITQTVKGLVRILKIKEYQILFSVRELKKTSLKLLDKKS